MTSRMKAVFFDLDDTLVATSDHDARAFTAAVALASSLSKDVVINEERLLADFLSEFRRVPWDPENEIEVSSWRARLWELALRKQKASNADSLGVSLQAGYRYVAFFLCAITFPFVVLLSHVASVDP